MEYYTIGCYFASRGLYEKVNKAFRNRDNAIKCAKEALESLSPSQWFNPMKVLPRDGEYIETRPANIKIVNDGCKVIMSADVEERILKVTSTKIEKIVDGEVYYKNNESVEVIKDWNKREYCGSEFQITVYIEHRILNLEEDKIM